MKPLRLLIRGERGQGIIEFILIIGAIVASSVVAFSVYQGITSSGSDKLEASTNTVSDQMSIAIQDAMGNMETAEGTSEETSEETEFIEIEEEEVKQLNTVYSREDLTTDKCVKVDVGGSAASKFTVSYDQNVKIHRPSMHLRLSNFCDISVETVTLEVDGKVYWRFQKSFFDYIKEWLKRIIRWGKLKNYNHHFYYRNIELDLGPGEHEITFRWTGIGYAKSNSAYTGEIRAAVTTKKKKKIAKT